MMGNSRNQTIVRTSIIGVTMNVLLFALKIVVGTLSDSIAITLDAVNNLPDAASSVITLVGGKLAGKEPDKEHPFGHGRIEYFSALIISLLVLYAGVASLEASVCGILHPETPTYTSISLIIIAIAVVVKIALGRYFVTAGKRVDSNSLINSGKDATLDLSSCKVLRFLSRFAPILSKLGFVDYRGIGDLEKEPKLHILLVGYNGARNTGADVRVAEIVKQLQQRLGKEKVQALAGQRGHAGAGDGAVKTSCSRCVRRDSHVTN
ncbi:MAG: cation diffusion facilitator family transporter [Clostridiales bacterium]|nr:cation diffusion facilitator family transporter [Clostridiales bacterium]